MTAFPVSRRELARGGRFQPFRTVAAKIAIFSIVAAAWCASSSVWSSRFGGAAAHGDEPAAAATEAKPAEAEGKPAEAKPVQAEPAKPVPAQQGIQVQIQQGGGKVQIMPGGRLQIQGNVQIQVQANGAIQVNGANVAVGDGSDAIDGATTFRPADRALQQRLTKSESLIEEGRYAEAVEMLGGILEQPEDFFYRSERDMATARSLKGEAQRRIGSLPPAGRDAYELQYGAKAKQMLAAAVEAGDDQALAETSRRYFHTEAGLRATYLLGLTHLDRGRPLAAALCWRRLRESTAAVEFEPELSLQLAMAWARAGSGAAAVAVIEDASRKHPGAAFQLGGGLERWPAGGDRALAWLTAAAGVKSTDGADRRAAGEWLLAGGDASRNAVSTGSNPLLNRRWAVPYVNHPDVEKLTEVLSRGYQEQAGAPLPAAQPLAVGETVLMRTLGGLLAIDFRTGKRIWRGATDERIEQLLQRDAPLAGRPDQDAGQLATLVEERLWHNAAFGTSSSDGSRVFCIEVDLTPQEKVQRRVIMFNGRAMMPGQGMQGANRIAAYDLATEGKLLWELGGPHADDAAPGAQTYFLGAPLPLGDKLYALGESRGEIRLYVVDAATGKIDWTQQLAMAPEGFDLVLRRSCGLSPSYADGVLICPTALGAVVAVDLNDRSLLWGFQYPQTGMEGRTANRMLMWQLQAQRQSAEEDRWHDALTVVSDGSVLVAPPDGDYLYCLSLVDGAVRWKQPRDHGLYIAGAMEKHCLVVAAGELRAFRLDDGKSAWTLPWPDGAKPSGRGFYNGSHYFMPLSSAEVAAVDVAAGKIVARSRSRSGSVPGNLVSYRGAVLSQGVNGLECFYQLDDLRREVAAKLKASPGDPAALASQGELFLDEGKTAEAVESLRQAYAKVSDPRTRNLLVDALLEGLAGGTALASSDITELERLAVGTLREETYLRLRAEAHEKAGDDRQAFDVYLRLVDLPQAGSEPVRVSAGVSIGREQRVKAKLQSLFARAKGETRTAMAKVVAERRATALAADDTAALSRYLEYFGDAPDAADVRLALAARAVEEKNFLAAENLLRREAEGTGDRAREATARLATLLHDDAKRPADAIPYLTRLRNEFADLPVRDGKSGREVADGIARADAIAKLVAPHRWPTGRVDVAEVRQQQAGMIRNFPLEFRGPREPYFVDQSIEMDQSQQALVCRDASGVERWRVTLAVQAQRRTVNINPSVSHVRADGHLLIVSLGNEIVAVDTLGTGSDKPARILWRVDLNDVMPGMQGIQNVHPRVVQMPWRVPRFMAADGNGRPIGTTGPVTLRYAAFLKQRTLHVVEPLSGKVLWIRHDIDPGSDLFGDDEYLFVTPSAEARQSLETLVLRVSDGDKVKDVRLPRPEQRVAAYGRRLLSWGDENGKSVLKLVDGLDGKVVWSETFTGDAKLWPVSADEAAVFTKAGKLAVFNIADGAKRLEATVMPEPQLSDAYVFRTPEAYLLVTTSPLRPKDGVNIQPVPGGFGNPLVNGYVYGFDRASQKQLFRTRVAGHGLTLNQPTNLPILVFASQRYEQLARGQMRSPEAMIFCIDKRTGRVVYDKRQTTTLNMVDLSAEPDRNAVVMKSLRSSLRFTFTDEPIPPDDEKPADDEGEANDSLPAKVGAAIINGADELGAAAREVQRNAAPRGAADKPNEE